jgi:WS/DGAT/MGAT family acyltransferase
MPRYAYDRLTALDNSFLLLEKANSYMHVASTLIFDAGPLRRPEGGVDVEAIRAATEAALPQIPRYRQKLKYIPLENHPVWVDDDRFNLDYHLRHTALPKPGSVAQLKALSARIMQQHLDRSRPLWEMWVVEGLEGDRFALISKVHHCMIDGVSGVDLLNTQLRTSPERDIPELVPYFPRPAPSGLELLRHELLRRAALPLAAVRDVRNFVREATDARREVAVRLRAVAETLGTTLRRGSETPLNRPIGPHRRFDWLSMDVAEIKEVRKALGGSLNDVVLTVVTGAVRRFLERRGVNPRGLDFRVMAPVSVRSADERGRLGNRVSAWMIDLPVALPDPRQQLERIAARTRELKESKQAVGAEVLTQAADWTPSTLLALGARNVTRLLPFNMVVTNVPGPQVPMYLLGARMLEAYPHVPLIDRLGLGIALLSYDGRIGWGFNADYDVVPDLSHFVEDVRASFQSMRDAAGALALRSEAAPPRPKPARATRSNGSARPPASA